jgi:hypothetical protein
MKKTSIALALLIFAFAGSNLYAQGLGLGIKAGANFANQNISDISTDSRTGFHGGAYLVLGFSEKWAIQPEVLFSSQGSELPNTSEINKFNYLSIPILLRWKPVSLISIEAGPQFSSLVSAVDKSGDSIKEDFKNSDFGMALGASVHLPLGLNGGLRYVWGFTNVNDLENDREVKNKMVQVYVGWTILGDD